MRSSVTTVYPARQRDLVLTVFRIVHPDIEREDRNLFPRMVFVHGAVVVEVNNPNQNMRNIRWLRTVKM